MQILNDLPTNPADFTAALKSESAKSPVLVVKFSPICPISHGAEERFRSWSAAITAETPLSVVELDVIEQRELARGLTAELGIKHESPQALLIKDGAVVWHDSHRSLTEEAFADALQGC